MATGDTSRFGIQQRAFQAEFAAFVAFVGGTELDKIGRKVAQKLRPLGPQARALYGDRYFFHEQLELFVYGTTPFQLDTKSLYAVRAASLIAGVNRLRTTLSPSAAARLRSMVIDNLQPDRDVRQIEHEVRSYTHLGLRGFDVTFADLEELGRFDLLLERQPDTIEVECKTVTEDTGSQIKVELNVELSEEFRRIVNERNVVAQSGLVLMTLKRPASTCKHLGKQLTNALQSETGADIDVPDFSLRFSGKPHWQQLLDAGHVAALRQTIRSDPEIGADAHCVTKVSNRLIGLVVRPHKPSTLSSRVVQVIKDAADQCSGDRPCVVWLHFVGMAEAHFLELAQFSSDGSGRGLNVVVANTVHPRASSTDRTHVAMVRFSADPASLSSHLAVRPDRLLGQAVSAGGSVYDVPNPYCRFRTIHSP